MLNELYNKIKEDKAFRDLFQPISKEELEKRKKERIENRKKEWKEAEEWWKKVIENRKKEWKEKEERWKEGIEDSDYDYFISANVEGMVSWAYDECVSPAGLANGLVITVSDFYREEEEVDLIVSISDSKLREDPDEDVLWPYVASGLFSGSIIILSCESLDEQDTANRITGSVEAGESDPHAAGKMEVSNVKVSNLRIRSKEE